MPKIQRVKSKGSTTKHRANTRGRKIVRAKTNKIVRVKTTKIRRKR